MCSCIDVAQRDEPCSDSGNYGKFLQHNRKPSTGLVGPPSRNLQSKVVPVKMKVDTGSPVSKVTQQAYTPHRRHWPALD
ncbi:hypothetical protein HPB50_027472 [Hyalomma asiaticum]|uniref:Uncharacterized protein n=1 Tax=Hyalomma asiaticum TaxID=266040 RepID=A0ACB7T4K1_HYAAI|nr:hypothetical protein HPB50_027472 [Hyalomma asiaticum]